MSESIEDIAARLQRRIDLYGGRADFHALMKSYAELETSWRERGEALKEVLDAVADQYAIHPLTLSRAYAALNSAERSSPQES